MEIFIRVFPQSNPSTGLIPAGEGKQINPYPKGFLRPMCKEATYSSLYHYSIHPSIHCFSLQFLHNRWTLQWWSLKFSVFIPVVVWLKGPVLIQAQILGLLVGQLCKMCIKCGEMKAGHILVWRARERKNMLTFARSLWLINLSNEERKRSSRTPLGFSYNPFTFSIILFLPFSFLLPHHMLSFL